ncbi:unnamed protein product [Protopolystoma xenopodis]|uniref:Uncharacterized protein n=1 Tax=Protopolystoma xenopodis TaxID=117903 RepID=A0A3S5BQF5_9PLAT|nr:unnamed protein product [Protopolystoma xenopodis]
MDYNEILISSNFDAFQIHQLFHYAPFAPFSGICSPVFYCSKIKVWNLKAALDPRSKPSQLCICTLQQHTGRVFRLQFDDFQIVSSSHDDNILIWDFVRPTTSQEERDDGFDDGLSMQPGPVCSSTLQAAATLPPAQQQVQQQQLSFAVTSSGVIIRPACDCASNQPSPSSGGHAPPPPPSSPSPPLVGGLHSDSLSPLQPQPPLIGCLHSASLSSPASQAAAIAHIPVHSHSHVHAHSNAPHLPQHQQQHRHHQQHNHQHQGSLPIPPQPQAQHMANQMASRQSSPGLHVLLRHLSDQQKAD